MENKEKKQISPSVVVGALVINKKGNIFLARGKKWGNKFSVPGGHVNLDESLKDAIKREVKEELKIDVEIKNRISFGDNVLNGDYFRKKHFVFIDFLCSYDGGDDKMELNDEFSGEYKWIEPEKSLKLDLAGGVRLMIEDFLEQKKQEEYLGGWKRCQADFENYKKRQAESQKDIIKYSTENIVTQILPVLDNFQSAMEHISEEQKNEAWVQGITHIQKQLETVLADNGVEEVKIKVGDDFNPEIHEAVESDANNMNGHSNDTNKLKIKKVILKGYKIGDKIIRPARVTVK